MNVNFSLILHGKGKLSRQSVDLLLGLNSAKEGTALRAAYLQPLREV